MITNGWALPNFCFNLDVMRKVASSNWSTLAFSEIERSLVQEMSQSYMDWSGSPKLLMWIV